MLQARQDPIGINWHPHLSKDGPHILRTVYQARDKVDKEKVVVRSKRGSSVILFEFN